MKRSKVIATIIVAIWTALCIKWPLLIFISAAGFAAAMLLWAVIGALSDAIDSIWPDKRW